MKTVWVLMVTYYDNADIGEVHETMATAETNKIKYDEWLNSKSQCLSAAPTYKDGINNWRESKPLFVGEAGQVTGFYIREMNLIQSSSKQHN